MTLSIEEQFDLKALERFDPFLGKKRIVDSGLFLKGIDDFIVKDKDVTIRVLRNITLGRVDIFNQERIFVWLDKLRFRVKKNSPDEISEAFFATMQTLLEKTDIRFKRRDYQAFLNKEEASQYYGFYGSAGLISYGLRLVRLIANREAYKNFGYKYCASYPAHLVDFPARLRIFIRNPKDKKFAKEFEGRYEGGATISKLNEALWELCFDKYFLSTHHEYRWNLTLWMKIFTAIHPFLCELLDADITYTQENEFND